MKQSTLVITLTIFCLQVFAQKTISIQKQDSIIGYHLQTGKEIKSTSIHFPLYIYRFSIDSTHGLAHLQLRGLSANKKSYLPKGTIAAYDLDSNKINWSENVKDPSFLQNQNGLVNVLTNKSVGYNLENGHKEWENKKRLIYISDDAPFGMAYGPRTSTNEPSQILNGVNLTDGSDLWSRMVSREYGWDQFLKLSDTTVLISASGLHQVNLMNGTGWTYHAVTGDDDYKRAILTNAAGVALGVLTGSFMFSTGHDVITDMSSGVIINNDFLYYASKEYLVKLEKVSGRTVWEVKLPTDITSKSDLYLDGDYVYLINRGSAQFGYRTVGRGEPYIACFSVSDGKQLQLIKLPNKSFEFDWDIRQGLVYIVYSDRIDRYDPLKTTEVTTKMFSINDDVIRNTIGGHVFIKDNDSAFKRLVVSDTNTIFIYSRKGDIYKIMPDFSMQKITDIEQVYFWEDTYKEYRILRKRDKLFLIDQQGKAIALLNTSGRDIEIKNNTLYVADKNVLHMINLDNIKAD